MTITETTREQSNTTIDREVVGFYVKSLMDDDGILVIAYSDDPMSFILPHCRDSLVYKHTDTCFTCNDGTLINDTDTLDSLGIQRDLHGNDWIEEVPISPNYSTIFPGSLYPQPILEREHLEEKEGEMISFYIGDTQKLPWQALCRVDIPMKYILPLCARHIRRGPWFHDLTDFKYGEGSNSCLIKDTDTLKSLKVESYDWIYECESPHKKKTPLLQSIQWK